MPVLLKFGGTSGDAQHIASALIQLIQGSGACWGIFDGMFAANDKIAEPVRRSIWRALNDDFKVDLLLYLALLVENSRVTDETWAAFTTDVDQPFERRGIMMLRSLKVEPKNAVKELLFISPGSILAICEKLEDCQKLILDGKGKKALAIKTGVHEPGKTVFYYAAIPQERVLEVRATLERRLRPLQDTFLEDIKVVEEIVKSTIKALFDSTRFDSSREIVAFTGDESFVFSEIDLQEAIKKPTTNLKKWSALLMSQISDAWKHIPEPIIDVPKYFV